MSIIIQFNPAPVLSSVGAPPIPACVVEAEATLEMGPEQKPESNVTVLSQEESSVIELPSHILYSHSAEDIITTSSNSHRLDNCAGLPYQDHNYGAPPPPTPPSISPHLSPPQVNNVLDEEASPGHTPSSINYEELTEGSVTRCVCGFDHDDEYMICCDRCLVWQHVDCMGLDRNNIPDTYLCEKCEPRKVDRQKAKVLQARKKVAMTDTSGSDDESSNKISGHSSKIRVKNSKKRKDSDKCDGEHSGSKGNKSKHEKERIEAKRSKLRKRSKSKTETTSTADEEAQDAWECSLEWFEKKYEDISINQYSTEVQLLVNNLPKQGGEHKIAQQLRFKLCEVDSMGCTKRLISTCDVSKDQVIIEYKGKFTLATHFFQKQPIFNKRFLPFILFYKLTQSHDICVDATEYGNDARFVRRSCTPNSEVRSIVSNGVLHLYIAAIKDIKKSEEITIPFDFDYQECFWECSCVCSSESCFLMSNKKNGSVDSSCERKRKGKRPSVFDDDSNHSLPGNSSSPVKSSKRSPVKSGQQVVQQVSSQCSNLLTENSKVTLSEEQDPDEQVTEQKRKMTREERKIDAIMRAFDQMEKAAKRRQQALDRLAQQKAQQQQQPQQHTDEQGQKQESDVSVVKDEEKAVNISNSEVLPEDEKSTSVVHGSKHKKGKRRRGSGTPARRRTRTNSGGSDVFVADDTSVPESNLIPLCCEAPTVTSPVLSNIQATASPTPSPTTILPKTKRFLLHEWLQEKAELNNQITSASVVPAETTWKISTATPTCYVRCTRDSPSYSGISAAHLRRIGSSTHCRHASGQGSAKKRWLRQAMYDGESCDLENNIGELNNCISSSPHHNGSLSPNSLSEMSNCDLSLSDDVVTPLKKRRLIRKSIDSLPSPKSPTVCSDWVGFTSPEHCSSDQSEKMSQQLLSEKNDDSNSEKPTCDSVISLNDFTKSHEVNGLSIHVLKSMRKKWIKNVCESEVHSVSTSDTSTSIVKCTKNEPVTIVDTENFNKDVTDCMKYESSKNVNNLFLTVNNCERNIENKHTADISSSSSCNLDSSCIGSNTLSSESPDLPSSSFIDTNPLKKEEGNSILNTSSNKALCQTPGVDMSISPSVNTISVNLISSGNSDNPAQDSSCLVTNKLAPDKNESDVPFSSEKNKLSEIGQEVNCVSGNSKICPDKIDSGTESDSSLVVFDALASILSVADSKCSSECCNVSNSNNSTNLVCSSYKSTITNSDTTADAQNCEIINAEESFSDGLKSCDSDLINPNKNNSSVNIAETLSTSKSVAKTKNFTVTTNKTSTSSNTNFCTTFSESTINANGNSAVSQTAVSLQNYTSVSRSQKSCEASTQKRKVSLSEYRKRKLECNSVLPDVEKKKISNCTLNTIITPESTAEKDIKLAALPLFEVPVKPQNSAKVTSEEKELMPCSNTHDTDSAKPRENLSERLKREFGLDDDTDEKNSQLKLSKQESANSYVPPNIAPLLSLCNQPPPPPPPVTQLPSTNTSPSVQFPYPVAQPYMQQSYAIAQVAARCATVPSPLPSQVVPVVHHVQNLPHSLVPSPHTYSATMQNAVSRAAQINYSSANKKNYANSIQRPPPPPPPASHPVYRPGFKHTLFK